MLKLTVLILAAVLLTAAPIQAQGQGAELPSDFCFVFVGGASPVEWDENGCVADRRARYSKVGGRRVCRYRYALR